MTARLRTCVSRSQTLNWECTHNILSGLEAKCKDEVLVLTHLW